ncbi:tRNA lysidine(34) synthetase TilS [Bellilinea sp.]|uniref:tRNA lysidine(34) synthetase TilS n=1 Tax=Bellilinea sp. TaxID=2838785 RepID=UPI002ADDC039|nr:tRNA lysidine(34) synthetase TilS [Bellilinea sp.]
MRERCGILGDKPLVVGVSGGADSLTLLHLFCRLKMPVWVVYFDHQLRPESKNELLAVRQLAELWQAKGFISGQGDVRRLAENSHISLEAAARQARYRFLFETAERMQAQAVAVGHTADDQVETVLMHLIRGTGLDGLRGMEYRTTLQEFSSTIFLIRPLLSFWRTEIEQYCRENGIQPLQDVTNQSLEFTRNRIRHELIPILQGYNPQIKVRIWTMSRVVNDHLRLVKPLIEKALDEVCMERKPGEYLTFSYSRITDLPEELLIPVLRDAIKHLKPASENVDWQALNLAASEIRSGRRTGTIQLGDGIEMVFSQDRIYIKEESGQIFDPHLPSIPSNEEITLNGGGEITLGGEWLLKAEIFPAANLPARWKENPYEAWLDADHIKFPLKVRRWRRGERFRPLGMESGSVKIADYLTERKIPRLLRAQYPLVYSGDDVVWLPGMQIANQFRLTSNTQRVLHLILVRS